MNNTKKNAFYAQSGGVTSVINASAAGVIESARKHKKYINKLYAGQNGILGALNQDLIDTSFETKSDIRISNTLLVVFLDLVGINYRTIKKN